MLCDIAVRMGGNPTQLLFEVTAHPSETLIVVFQHVLRPKRVARQSVRGARESPYLREYPSLMNVNLSSVGCGFWWDSHRQRVVIRPGSIERGVSLSINF